MTNSFIPVEEAAKDWLKDPAFVAEYEALEEEFVLAAAISRKRNAAIIPQEEVVGTDSRLRISFEPKKPHSKSS